MTGSSSIEAPVSSGSTQDVFYASYASNLPWQGAFQCYIEGGRRTGSNRDLAGCTDKTTPRRIEAVTLAPQQLYFAWESWNWDQMGAAFTTANLDPEQPEALGRAYLLTGEQFGQVVAAENGIDPKDLPEIDLDRVKDQGEVQLFSPDEEPYSGVVWCGEIDGIPMVTFTAVPGREDYNMPSSPYLAMISRGLIEAHGLSEGQSADYLWQSRGIDRKGYASSGELATYIGRSLV